MTARLTELHGTATNALGAPRAGTHVYLDAAGAPQVLQITQASAKWCARLVIVAIHKKPVDISGILRSELTIIGSMGYPEELFKVTPVLAANWERFSKIISHRVPFSDVPQCLRPGGHPGSRRQRSLSPSTTDTSDVWRTTTRRAGLGQEPARRGRGRPARRRAGSCWHGSVRVVFDLQAGIGLNFRHPGRR